METTLKLAIAAKLDKNDLIEGEAHQIQRFGNGRGARIFRVGHFFLIERMKEKRGKRGGRLKGVTVAVAEGSN